MNPSIQNGVSFAVLSSDVSVLSPVLLAIEKVIPLTGLERVDDPADAHIVFTVDSEASLVALKDGKCVMQLALPGRKASVPVGSGLLEAFPQRYAVIRDVTRLLPSMTQALTPIIAALVDDDVFDSALVESTSVLENKRILVVDDSARHRAFAEAQFAAFNSLVLCSSYVDALTRLRTKESFDVVFTDLMMPTEGLQLGERKETELGRPLAVGHHVINAAIAAEVPEIVLVTDGNHHDDGFIAVFKFWADFVAGSSRVSYHNCQLNEHKAKDWTSAYETHLKRFS